LKVYPDGNGVVRGNYLSVFLELSAGLLETSKYEYRVEMIHQGLPSGGSPPESGARPRANRAASSPIRPNAEIGGETRFGDRSKNIVREFASDFDVGECWGYNRFFRLDLLAREGYHNQENDTLVLRFEVRPPTYFQKCRDQQWYIAQLRTLNNQYQIELSDLKQQLLTAHEARKPSQESVLATPEQERPTEETNVNDDTEEGEFLVGEITDGEISSVSTVEDGEVMLENLDVDDGDDDEMDLETDDDVGAIGPSLNLSLEDQDQENEHENDVDNETTALDNDVIEAAAMTAAAVACAPSPNDSPCRGEGIGTKRKPVNPRMSETIHSSRRTIDEAMMLRLLNLDDSSNTNAWPSTARVITFRSEFSFLFLSLPSRQILC
jgi:tripartite motif-containing protein 37